jgi:organic hydroperoxide reductase OsmC/OhrA
MAERYGGDRTARLRLVATAQARTFDYEVALDAEWAAVSDRGGDQLPHDEESWTPEHLLLAALCRCTLTSLRHHARRSGLEPVASSRAHGVVTQRDEDGRFAFVAIDVALDVRLEPTPDAAAVGELVAKAERDCFIGASLAPTPAYRWIVNGKPIA